MDSQSGSQNPPVVVSSPAPSPKKAVGGRNAALTALVGNLADSVSTAVTSIGLSVGSGVDSTKIESPGKQGGGSSVGNGGVDDKSAGVSDSGDDFAEDIVARSDSYKMDVQDFIDAVEIDDVLIQVIQLKPRTRLMKVMRDTMDGVGDNPDKTSTLPSVMSNNSADDNSVQENQDLAAQRFGQFINDALSSKPRSRTGSTSST